MSDYDRISQEVRRFRSACERYASDMATNDPEDGCFPEFPRGFCDHVSDMLAQHLHEVAQVAYERMEIVWEAEVPGGHHAWLEVDGLVVDITEDQIDGHSITVLASESPWHRSLGGYRVAMAEAPCDESWPGLDRLRAIQRLI